MLSHTFLHLPSIGTKTERTLWAQGITNWDALSTHLASKKQTATITATLDALAESRDALAQQDAVYFAKKLPASARYRVALAFPEHALFLHLDTTGNSPHYDTILVAGWSLGGTYNAFITGQNDEEFRHALQQAKVIISLQPKRKTKTFIAKHFGKQLLPSTHIMLQNVTSRVGIGRSAKRIEKVLSDIRSPRTTQEHSQLLWHSYQHGNLSALRQLVTQNHAAVEDMKLLLDACLPALGEKDGIPTNLLPDNPFSTLAAPLLFADNTEQAPNAIHLPRYTGSTGPRITYAELQGKAKLNDLVIAGIDLVSSEKKGSGFCLLRGNNAETCRAYADDEMVQQIQDANATIVCIDSPLGLPKSRNTCWDDDPARKEFGITRECDRVLQRRGVPIYPTLIPSMQKLTYRGIHLAKRLRNLGLIVLESYPGGVQDVLNIPRKQVGTQYLAKGLLEFGIVGEFADIDGIPNASHDELDAISAAMTGLFYEAKMFEALGDEDEGLLIIPKLPPSTC